MADLSEVEDALVLLTSTALYPDGLTNPSVVGADCRIYRGWPIQSGLNSDLAAGIVNVTVFPSPRPGRMLVPLPIVYKIGDPLPAFTASVAGETASFSGTPAPGHCAGILVDGRTYVYRPAKGDSAGMVAAALADLVRIDRIAQLSGATVIVPGANKLVARVVSDQSSAREIRRQERELVIACWCSTPTQRDVVAKTIDSSMSVVAFIPMPDASSSRLTYLDTTEYDQAQNANLYRRDLIYTAEFPTVIIKNDPAMLFGVLELGAASRIS